MTMTVTSQHTRQRHTHTRYTLWRTLSRILMYGFLLGAVVLALFPMIYAFFASFKPLDELLADGARLLPRTWNLQNYSDAWQMANFAEYFVNTLIVTVSVVILDLLASSMCGYVLARKRTRVTRLIEILFGLTIFLGVGTITLYPKFLLALQLGILNLSGVVIVELAGITVIHTLLIKAYCQSLNRELYEAAALDGCSFFGTYWRIALPLMRPIVATTAILAFEAAWNNFQAPLVFTLSNPDLRTITVGVYALRISSDGASSWNLMMAGAMLSLIPIVVIFLVLQKYFMKGATEGAVKG
ncbi:MAG: carbohydrate ABC transporter permease [Ktedonobacteraceae bacterium]